MCEYACYDKSIERFLFVLFLLLCLFDWGFFLEFFFYFWNDKVRIQLFECRKMALLWDSCLFFFLFRNWCHAKSIDDVASL